MAWRIKLEAKAGWGEVTVVEIASLSRRTIAATDEAVGMSLAESKAIRAALQQAIVTTRIGEYVTCARVGGDGDQRRGARAAQSGEAGDR